MNVIKPKNTKVGSFFLEAWVFSAARKYPFQSHPLGCSCAEFAVEIPFLGGSSGGF